MKLVCAEVHVDCLALCCCCCCLVGH